MSIQVERIENLPAVLATYDGLIKLDDVEQMFNETAELLSDIVGRYYRISDFRTAQSTFSDIVQIMGQARSNKPGSTNDPNLITNLITIFIGSNEWGEMVRKFFAQSGAKDIPFTTTVEEAITWIEEDIAKRK